MKKVVLLIMSCFLASLVIAASASAQTVVHVSMSNLTFVGASVCGVGNAACTETVNVFFDWNVTTSSIVSGSMSTVVSGAIMAPFTFANTGPVVGGQGFRWTDTYGDSVSVNTCGFDCGTFPTVGAYATVDVTLLCGSAGDICSTDGFNGVHPTNGTFTISTTPTCGSFGSLTLIAWAGYLLADSSCSPTVTSVSGSWIVANSFPQPGTTLVKTYQWVGIGGADVSPFNDGSLIQIGTGIYGNQPLSPQSYFAWYELLNSTPCLPSPICLPPIYVFAVNPGDIISASVTLSDAAANQWALAIDDLTPGHIEHFSTTVTFPAKRLTAEWILESCGMQCASTNFGTAYFGNDYTGVASTNTATINGNTVSLGTLPQHPIAYFLLPSPSPVSPDGTSFSVQSSPLSFLAAGWGSATATIQGGAASVQISQTNTSMMISGSAVTNGTPVTVNAAFWGNTQPPLTGAVNLGSAGFYDINISGIDSGAARVCISNGLSSLATMQYWNSSKNAWTSATNISVSNSFLSHTICGDISVAALSGTPIAVGIPSAPATPAHLVSALESITLNSSTDEYVALVSVTNTGGDTAKGVTVTASKLNDVRTSTNLPISVGDMSYAVTVPVALTFSARGSEEEDFGHLRIVETFTGGTAEQFLRVKLPRQGESERDDKDRENQDRDHPPDDH